MLVEFADSGRAAAGLAGRQGRPSLLDAGGLLAAHLRSPCDGLMMGRALFSAVRVELIGMVIGLRRVPVGLAGRGPCPSWVRYGFWDAGLLAAKLCNLRARGLSNDRMFLQQFGISFLGF